MSGVGLRPGGRPILGPLLCAVLSGCGGGLVTRVGAPPPAPPGQGWLQVRATPAEAEVHVDGRFFGLVSGWPEGLLRLPEGAHRVEIRAPRHYAWYGLVQIGAEPTPIDAALVPEPAVAP